MKSTSPTPILRRLLAAGLALLFLLEPVALSASPCAVRAFVRSSSCCCLARASKAVPSCCATRAAATAPTRGPALSTAPSGCGCALDAPAPREGSDVPRACASELQRLHEFLAHAARISSSIVHPGLLPPPIPEACASDGGSRSRSDSPPALQERGVTGWLAVLCTFRR